MQHSDTPGIHARDGLLRWYMERAQADEHFNIEGHEKRIRFFSGLNVAILTAIAAGVFQAHHWHQYLALLIGPVLMIKIDRIAEEGCLRYYNRVLEAIIVKAHVEQLLGLTRPVDAPSNTPDAYWVGEPVVPWRHLAGRHDHSSSSREWQTALQARGSQRMVRNLFAVFTWVARVLFAYLVAMLAVSLWS